jgi:hypothetical protein
MIILGLSVLGATIVVAVLAALVYLTAGKVRPEPVSVGWWVLRLWIFAFLLNVFILYVAMPAMTGPYWGWQWALWPLLFTGVFALFGGGFQQMRHVLDSITEQVNGETPIRPIRGRYRAPGRGWMVDQLAPQTAQGAPRTSTLAGAGAIVAALLIATLINGLIVAFTTWGDGNAKALSAIANVQIQPNNATLPPTDVKHIVLVTQGVAAYLGQQVLASGGHNLGSQYHTERSEYTLQSVNHHLYWIAPMVYNNVWANLGNWESPAFVVVDAEDPNSEATLKTGYHMHYLPDALFNSELLRHVYLSGYTDGDLADPTLEVDDTWTPYFTVSLTQPTRGFTGSVVKRVLLVDPQRGTIQSYSPDPNARDKVPSWVDRIIPSDTVHDYLNWWGLYHNASWFNPSGLNQQVPAGQIELVYNSVDQPVWLATMTSNSKSDQSSTGVVLYDTRDRTGRFYPISGIGVSDNVIQTIQDNPHNIQKYDVGNLQLYQINSEPTWVATFVRETTYGQNFYAVGMVDARRLVGANVIMAPTKAEALAQYEQWLAGQGVQGQGPSSGGKQVTLDGKVARISSAIQNGSTVYFILIDGQSRIFEAGLALSPKLPLVQPGDSVHITYLDTGQSQVTLTSFDDTTIQTGGS